MATVPRFFICALEAIDQTRLPPVASGTTGVRVREQVNSTPSRGRDGSPQTPPRSYPSHGTWAARLSMRPPRALGGRDAQGGRREPYPLGATVKPRGHKRPPRAGSSEAQGGRLVSYPRARKPNATAPRSGGPMRGAAAGRLFGAAISRLGLLGVTR